MIDELNKIKDKLKLIKEKETQRQLNQSLYYLSRIIISTLFNESRDINEIMTELKNNTDLKNRELKNEELGLYPWFDDKSQIISEEFGCPHCGEFCYAENNSKCEMEDCEYEGKSIVYCPKIKCNFTLKCQSALLPLGVSVDKPGWSGYFKNDIITISYYNKNYKFITVNDLSVSELYDLIRKFFDYNLTRIELRGYLKQIK